MAVISYSQLIFLLLLIIYCIIESNAIHHRRQITDGPNRNVGIPQQKPIGSVPLNNIPLNPSNNPKLLNNNNQLVPPTQSQIDAARSRGFYNSPSFQPPPFSGEKPSGWFGTNHINWISNRETELDKNKLAAQKIPSANNQQDNFVPPPPRTDGGPFFLEKVAKQYASKGDKAFNFDQFESRQGHGSICYNHDNFNGFIFGRFSCPLPASTGMNQQDQFCCGYPNYQYCCNNQEYSQTQRGGGFIDNTYINNQRFPKRSNYPPSTKKILAIILPIAGFIVLTGIVLLVFLYYKKFRREQNRARKLPGTIRLEDNYSVVPQELPMEKSISYQDES